MTLTAQLIESARSGRATLDPALLLLDADIKMRRGDFTGAYGALRLEASRLADGDPHRAVTMLLLAAKLEATEGLREVEEALSLLPTQDRDLVQLASLAMTRTMAGHPEARAAVLAAAKAAFASVHGHMHTLGIGWPLAWLEETERAEAFIRRWVSIQRGGEPHPPGATGRRTRRRRGYQPGSRRHPVRQFEDHRISSRQCVPQAFGPLTH